MNDYTEHTLQVTKQYDGAIFFVESHLVELPNHKQAHRDLIHHQGAVAILVVKDGEILLVRQFRKAVEQHLYEIPAGKLDHGPEESPLLAAKRELEEETNLAAANWTEVLELIPTPGYCDEKIHLFQATNVTPIANAAPLDEDEFVDVVWMPLEKAYEMIQEKNITDAKTIIAIQHALLRQGK